ncbi:hypothetical protein IWQ60_010040 [Tieghemiomyces parasiticus]|uniref:Uncharacterized protein n=1 Tax=Tieghemiomyces parasiticus TaxID=78921 RepID=A0A9W8DP63_9FUNG|nr:hypothetical protein IWQ60_010040 [Tieghemiomyces parasiticus]
MGLSAVTRRQLIGSAVIITIHLSGLTVRGEAVEGLQFSTRGYRCWQLNDAFLASGTVVRLGACGEEYADSGVFRLRPAPNHKSIVQILVGDKCLEANEGGYLTGEDCQEKPTQYFEVMRNQGQGMVKAVARGQCVVGTQDGRVGLNSCALAAQSHWLINSLGGSVCDSSIWEQFQNDRITIRQLMVALRMDYAAYTKTILSQGVPQLSEGDKYLLNYCDQRIRAFFLKFDEANRNMFSKLMNYKGSYATAVPGATAQTVDMFVLTKLSRQVWQNLVPARNMFVNQFTALLAMAFPQVGFVITLAKDAAMNQLSKFESKPPSEASEWGSILRDAFEGSVEAVWELHLRLFDTAGQSQYQLYADIYQQRTLEEIFGTPEKVQASMVVLLSKLVTRQPEMARSCCITQWKPHIGSSDYYDGQYYYRVNLPGKSHEELFSKPLSEFFDLNALLRSQDGWGLPTVQTATGLGGCRFHL